MLVLPRKVAGGITYNLDGKKISVLFVLHDDPTNPNQSGMMPSKHSCDPAVVDALPKDPAAYPVIAHLEFIEKVSQGKANAYYLSVQKIEKN